MRNWRKQLAGITMCAMVLLSLGTHLQAAAPPNIVTYQGRVLNDNGVPVSNSSLNMRFWLYSASSGGTCVWSNSSSDCDSNTPASTTTRSVSLTTGLFTQNLGDTGDSFASIPDTVFGDNTSIYLEVEIAGETLSPRKQLTAAPYALNAQRLDGIDSTGFLASTGDTGTGDYDFTGAVLQGASPLVFEGSTADDFETEFSFNEPTADRTITFQNASGTVAFTSDITASEWVTGTNGTVEPDDAVIIGTDAAFSYGSGGVGDLRVTDELEVLGDTWIDTDLVVGAFTSSTETLSNTGFSLGGDDLFVAGTMGVEGNIYTDAGFVASTDTTFSSGTITTTGSTDLLLAIAGGDITFNQATTLGDGAQTLAIDTSDWDISATGVMTGIGDITSDGTISASDLSCTDCLDFDELSDSLALDASTTVALDSAESLTFNNTGTGDIVFDLKSTGDLLFKDNGTTELSWLDSGLLAFDPTSEGISLAGTTIDLDGDRDTSISASSDDALKFELGGVASAIEFTTPQLADAASSGEESLAEFNLTTPADSTGTNIHSAVQIDLDIGNATGGTNSAIGLSIDSMTGDAQVNDLYGISIGDLTGTSATNEVGLKIGAGWDASIYFTDTSTNQINIADGSRLAIRDDGGVDVAIFQDVSNSANHIIGVDADTGLLFDSNADTDNDITSLNNEDLRIAAGGTGELVFGVDGDTGVQIEATATTDVEHLLEITNSGFASSTDATNALSIDYAISNASGDAINIGPTFTANGSDSYNAINIAPFTPSVSGSGNMLHGLSIGAPSGVDSNANIDGHAILLNDGWDNQIFYNDSSTRIQLQNGGSIEYHDGTNTLATLTDNGVSGTLSINTVTSPSILDIVGGNSQGTNPGGNVQIAAGINAGDPSGGAGGDVTLSGGAGAGNGTVARDGGDITLDGGNTTIGTGNGGVINLTGGSSNTGSGGDVTITGGASTSGSSGDVYILSGGTPTAVPVNGGDIGITSDDDFMLSSDDDFSLAVTSTNAVVNLFDNNVTKTIDIGGVNNDSDDTVKIATNSTTADNIEIGNNHASTVFALTGGNDWFITSSGVVDFAEYTIDTVASSTTALCWDNSGTSAIIDCTGTPTADYAEMFPVEAGTTYGDLMMLGTQEVTTMEGDTITQLVKAVSPYQETIVGIVANNYGDFSSTGYNINEEDNPMPIALVGRVPVNVVAEGGSISRGDYLTTSSTPGAAMKANGVGRVIGMAIDDWDGVSPTVMVQVHNSFYLGDVINTDGTSTVITDNVVMSGHGSATSSNRSVDSYGLTFRGSAWNGSEAEVVEMMMQNVVEDEDNYRLSFSNNTDTEVAYITNEGTMHIAGDMVIGGKLYPSDRGEAQTDKYIFYDGSAGAGGDFMRTNAKGWAAGSYDYAEMFPSQQVLKAGEVVAFSGTNEEVRRATGSDTERLAGIVSTRPGFIAGHNEAGAHPIALAGRVPTYVSTENGSISVGDALTASSTAGVAMKATEEGQIIGYALENYTGSESDNLIVVFVNVGDWNGEVEAEVPGTTNVASQTGGTATNFASLNMSGNINMGTHNILGIGRLQGMNAWSIEADGTIKTEGLVKNVIDSYQGTRVETIAVTSPEATITLTGTATLENGSAEIRFENVVPEYNDVISATAPIRVVVTPNGPSSLYVSEKDQNHFVVKSFAGSSEVEFDWMVSAYRKGFDPDVTEVVVEEAEDTVTEDATEEENLDETISEETTDEDSVEDTEADASEDASSEEVMDEDTDTVSSTDDETVEEVVEEVVEDEPADEVTEEESETDVTEEPATPESPVENLVDSISQDDGDESVEEPSDS